MWSDLLGWLPPEGVKIVLVLFLSFLVGLEREERKSTGGQYAFGGVRSFPLIGLTGYAMALLSGERLELPALGFAAVAGFMLLSYRHKLTTDPAGGLASELSALTTFLVGVLIFHGQFWVATAISIASLILLDLKQELEALARRIEPREIFTFAQFMLITAVILPVLPNRGFGPFQLNPFRTWLAVVAVSAVSFGSYVCLRLSKGRGGMLLAALIGGAYSSTVTSVALARRAAQEQRPNLISGAVLMASGVMYLRLLVLIGLFNRALLADLSLPFASLAAGAVLVGWLWSRRPDDAGRQPQPADLPSNPLELRSALLFGVLFLVLMALSRAVAGYAGRGGLLGLAALMGLIDVDPFVVGMTQSAGSSAPTETAAAAVLLAASSNNLAKGAYVLAWADRRTGWRSLLLLAGLALLGVLPLLSM